GVDRVARLVGVMRADGVGHDLGLAEAARVVGADDRVRAVDGVGARLADVVHERGAARELDVEAELVGHHAAEERGLDGVLPLVLRVRGAPVEPPDELDDVGVRARDLELLEGAAAELDHLALEVFLDLLDGDARLALPGAVLLELADGAAGDLAAERVLPFEAHRRLIVGERERDVRDFLNDRQVGHEARAEAGRQKEVRLQSLGQVVALVALDGDAHDALGFAAMLGVGERLIDAAQLVGGARLGVGDPLADEAVAELAAGFAGDLLEAANDVLLDAATGVVVLATGGFELLEALLALVDGGGARARPRGAAIRARSCAPRPAPRGGRRGAAPWLRPRRHCRRRPLRPCRWRRWRRFRRRGPPRAGGRRGASAGAPRQRRRRRESARRLHKGGTRHQLAGAGRFWQGSPASAAVVADLAAAAPDLASPVVDLAGVPERACNVNQHNRSFDYGWADGTRVDVDFRRCAALVALLAARSQSRIPARVRFFDATPRIPSRSCSNVKFRKEKKRSLPSAHPKGGRRPRPWAARSRRTPGFPTISPAFRGSSRSSARKSCGSPVAGSGARTVTPPMRWCAPTCDSSSRLRCSIAATGCASATSSKRATSGCARRCAASIRRATCAS